MARVVNKSTRRAACFDTREGHLPQASVSVLRSARPPGQRRAGSARAASRARLAERALRYVEGRRRLRASRIPSATRYVVDRVESTPAGIHVVRLQQRVLGIPVYDGRCSVHFAVSGRIRRVRGNTTPLARPCGTAPALSAVTATLVAGFYLESQLGNHLAVGPELPRVVSSFTSPDQPTVLEKEPFRGPISARLALLPIRDRTRLVWEIHLVLPAGRGAYEVLVEAERTSRPKVLLCRSTAACAIEGAVFRFDPRDPRETVPFPLPASEYPALGGTLPTGFPWPWVAGDETDGNSTRTFSNNSNRPFKASVTGGTTRFDAAPEQGADQRVVNAFYVCNFLHDFFFMLGFDEMAGNFQRVNHTGLDGAGDHLVVRCFSGEVEGSANMISRRDGRSPELALGLLKSRHTALDTDVVIHEYTHGVTNRMIGGPGHHDTLMGKPQSEALGEGYSDYFAVSLRNYYRRRAGLAETWAFAAWSVGDPVKGWRRQSYEAGAFQGTYADLANGTFIKVHDAGQVWCRALLEASERMASALGGDAASRNQADELMWRLVVASLPLCQEVHPTFLDARDALLEAFDALATAGRVSGSPGALRAAASEAFRLHGMGRLASSIDASFARIVADFT